MQRRISQVAALAAGAFLAVTASVLAQANPHVGTWKMAVDKSKFAPGTAISTTTTKIDAAGAGVHATVHTEYADGTKTDWQFTANYDGKDSPVTGNCPYGESVAMTRLDARSSRSVYKHNGTVSVTQTAVISPDGKTRTVTSKGKNLKGQMLDNVNVYDRQ